MKKNEIYELVIKTIGIYLIVLSIFSIQYMVGSIAMIFDESVSGVIPLLSLLNVLPFIFYLTIGLLLIKYTDFVVSSILKIPTSTEVVQGINKEALMEVVLLGIGVYLIVSSIPLLCQWIFKIAYARVNMIINAHIAERGFIVRIIAQIIIGIWMVFNVQGITAKLLNLKHNNDEIDREKNEDQ